MVYLMAFISVITGFTFAFLSFIPDIQMSILYNIGIFLGFNIWGATLFVGAIITLIGLRFTLKPLTQFGAFVCFLMWCFTALTYFSHGFYYFFSSYALFHMTFFAYVYLSSSLGFIQRVSIQEALEVIREEINKDKDDPVR